MNNRQASSWDCIAALVLCAILVFAEQQLEVQASGPPFVCDSDEDCVAFGGQDSVCVDNTCSDPYENGCLRRRLGSKRVCNSDDPLEAVESGVCRTPSMGYLEVRLYARDWESSLFQAWILQIILSELLDVPTTIETGRLDINRNFYRTGSEIKDTDPEIDYNDSTDLICCIQQRR